MSFKPDDKVVVTDPVSPTGHQLGDRLTITAVSSNGQLLKAVSDDGFEATVWAHEVTPAK
jgi:hypothetical protein